MRNSDPKHNSFNFTGSIPASRDQFVGILRAKGYTLAEIGRRIGKSSERVRQIDARNSRKWREVRDLMAFNLECVEMLIGSRLLEKSRLDKESQRSS